MIYGYARVSSKRQKLQAQLDALSSFGCENIFKEKASAQTNRPEFDKLIRHLSEGDTLVVWKLDRLGRSMFELVDIISTLQQRNISFISLTENIKTDTPSGKIMFMFFSMMAEYETSLRKERIESGKELARKNGRLGGRPRGLSKKLQEKSSIIKKMYLAKDGKESIYSISEIEKAVGVTRPSIYKCLRNQGVEINRGELF